MRRRHDHFVIDLIRISKIALYKVAGLRKSSAHKAHEVGWWCIAIRASYSRATVTATSTQSFVEDLAIFQDRDNTCLEGAEPVRTMQARRGGDDTDLLCDTRSALNFRVRFRRSDIAPVYIAYDNMRSELLVCRYSKVHEYRITKTIEALAVDLFSSVHESARHVLGRKGFWLNVRHSVPE